MIQIDLAKDGSLAVVFEDHTTYLPFTTKGMLALRAILVAREARPKDKIGTVAEPTQWNIEQWLRDHVPTGKKPFGLDIELEL